MFEKWFTGSGQEKKPENGSFGKRKTPPHSENISPEETTDLVELVGKARMEGVTGSPELTQEEQARLAELQERFPGKEAEVREEYERQERESGTNK